MKPKSLDHMFPVLLLFTTVLAARLGIVGPVNFGALKEWQTLMAASVAVVAASIAYLSYSPTRSAERQAAFAAPDR